ncbi:MAG: ABC transporter permease [Actinomycetota bacterium]
MTVVESPPENAGVPPPDDHEPTGVAEATPEFEQANERAKRRRGFLLALPAYAYLVIFFAVPLVIVAVYSFATRNRFRQAELRDFNLDSYRALGDDLVRAIVQRSLVLAIITTLICLVVAYPFAYFIATRPKAMRNALLVLVMIPFWTNFLVRNYAWYVILGTDGIFSRITEFIGIGETRLLFTQAAVVIGLVYGFLPFMILPLYAAIERIDSRLLEASRDLYASGFQSFRHVLLPLSMPGVVAGTILVFVPSLGAYVTPEILGGATTTLLGSHIVNQFFGASNVPLGAALSTVLMIVMLFATVVYFRRSGRTL